ncbi:ABC transporter ATP-binding protein [Anaerocolumna sp. AGMB13020]|uniref:ABC transporter ATP-binding protein n=1 Tax=Anaerocolumna sp. AGMB13020 TaxID=3081750 RepID=UPI002954C985|nr:ABC transporter ATP-binding protein [Anaerocolumna sp. AGMB13020]WOO37717.1 ABC transporter ATP-binding protein [Anaerocolumna sp. AGMB13020]
MSKGSDFRNPPGGGIAIVGEKHEFSAAWGKLINYCKPYFPAIILALACAVGGTVFTLTGPDMLSEMTDAITQGIMGSIDMKLVGNIALWLAAFYGASVVLSYLQGFVMATVTQKVSKTMRADISVKINKLPLKYFDKTSYGDILSRVTNDVDTIGQTLNQSIGNLVSAITLLAGSVIMMLVTNWIMALVAIGSSLLGFVIMILIISRSQKYFTEQQELLGAINGHVEEVYAGHNVVKVYNAEEELSGEFTQINKKLFSSNWKSQFMSGLMMPLMSFIGNIGYVAVCVAGAALAMKGSITFGVIVAFMVYVRLFTQPLSQIAQAATSLQSTGAASYRVFEFLGEAELEDESGKHTIMKTAKGDIEFKNVKFGYSENKIIIKDFSAKVKAGQKIAIVGPTGAGKTTMVNLLMRFYELNSGEIRIDNIPLRTLTRENVHQLFCMVLQDTWLFEGTIRENIVYNKIGVSEEEIVAACKAAGVHHFIKTLPEGYNTILNEEASLSAGQKQLITIARAMIENAPMLILDEATSSVDTRTEVLIQEAMDKLMEGRTSIVIAHRLSTIKNADLILVMKDGDIIESGNHEQLLRKKGFYAELYNSQFDEAS